MGRTGMFGSDAADVIARRLTDCVSARPLLPDSSWSGSLLNSWLCIGVTIAEVLVDTILRDS